MKPQQHKMEPRENAAAYRRIKCPTCGAGKDMNCVNVAKSPGKARKPHQTRIEAAQPRRTSGRRPSRVKSRGRHKATRKRTRVLA